MSDEQLGRIKATQDAMAKAIRDAKVEKLEDTLAARRAELERVALSAASVGVSPEDYHKWASGRPMPEVHEAVKRFMAGR